MKPSWNEYYQKILKQPHRLNTESAVKLLFDLPKVATDCGCGIGRDSAFLLDSGFDVHAFDKEQEAIDVCRRRFKATGAFHGTLSSFSDYSYPQTSLILAHSSLFFCPRNEFIGVWEKLTQSLSVGGVISVDLLGEKDSWVHSPTHDVSFFSKEQVHQLFDRFRIVEFSERDEAGSTAIGNAKHWHIYSILAVRQGS